MSSLPKKENEHTKDSEDEKPNEAEIFKKHEKEFAAEKALSQLLANQEDTESEEEYVSPTKTAKGLNINFVLV